MQAKKRKLDREERRENILRPSPYLGYDRDELGLYFNDRGVEDLAEVQFRRAVWLNPYEVEFKVHLSECLYRRKKYVEAAQWADDALKQKPDHQGAKNLKKWIEERSAIESRSGHSTPSTATSTE